LVSFSVRWANTGGRRRESFRKGKRERVGGGRSRQA